MKIDEKDLEKANNTAEKLKKLYQNDKETKEISEDFNKIRKSDESLEDLKK